MILFFLNVNSIYSWLLGDIVSLHVNSAQQGDESLQSGVVTHAGKAAISVAFDEKDLFSLDENEQYKLTKLANDITYRRLKKWEIIKSIVTNSPS
jgi:ATP-dependent RNA/DNA helicase IGHMBP2